MSVDGGINRLADAVSQLASADDFNLIPNQYVARSLLQKALRRGDSHYAERAALSLSNLGNSLWRALVVCAFEDFGPSSPETLTLTVAGCASKYRRSHIGGDALVARAIIQELCRRPRDRRVDELYVLGDSSTTPPDHGIAAEICRRLQFDTANAPTEAPVCRRLQFDLSLIDQVAQLRSKSERPVPGRSFTTVRAKEADEFLIGARENGLISANELATCLQARRTSQCLLPVVYPLAKSTTAQLGDAASSQCCTPPEVRLIGDIPGYAFDGFTREGQHVLGLLPDAHPPLRALLQQLPSHRARMIALRAMLFAVEGGVCTEEVCDPAYEELKALAMKQWIGVPEDMMSDALAIMRDAIPTLNDLRGEAVP